MKKATFKFGRLSRLLVSAACFGALILGFFPSLTTALAQAETRANTPSVQSPLAISIPVGASEGRSLQSPRTGWV